MILAVPAGPLVTARTYLLEQLAKRGNPLPVGVTVPAGQPAGFALLSRVGLQARSPFTVDCAIRVRVFNADAVACESDADLLWALMCAPVNRCVGPVWIAAAQPGEDGPSDLDDPDITLFGLHFSVRWTLSLKPLSATSDEETPTPPGDGDIVAHPGQTTKGAL